MKEIFNTYRWLFHGILAGLLVVISILLPLFNPERVIVTLVGVILVGFASYRLVMLKKDAKWDNVLIKRINLIEMIVHLSLGVFLVLWIWAFDETLGLLLGYIIGAILIARGSVYFYSDANKEVNDDFMIFALHIGAIIGGTYIIFQGDFTAEVLMAFVIAIALRRSFKYGFLAYNGFREKQNKSLEPNAENNETVPEKDIA